MKPSPKQDRWPGDWSDPRSPLPTTSWANCRSICGRRATSQREQPSRLNSKLFSMPSCRAIDLELRLERSLMANPPTPDIQAAIEALRERELTIENAWDALAEITAKVLDNEFG